MKYKCTRCDRRCTVVMRAGDPPVGCPMGDREPCWIDADLMKTDLDNKRGYHMYLTYTGRPVNAVNAQTGQNLFFVSASQAASRLKLDRGNVNKALRSLVGNKTVKGWAFTFTKPNENPVAMARCTAARAGYAVFKSYIACEGMDEMMFEKLFGEPLGNIEHRRESVRSALGEERYERYRSEGLIG